MPAGLALCLLMLAGVLVQGSGGDESPGDPDERSGGTAVLRDGDGRESDADPDPSSPPGEATPDPDTPQPPSAEYATEMLDALPVKGRAPKTGYDRRERFGHGWKDPDRNGCDARNDTLRRDLTEVVLDGPCKVLSGVLIDPYTGTRIDFVRGDRTSQAVQIDHLVALSDAWQKGAQALTQEQRIAFANDPLNLLAVDGSVNSSKGDGDAATWLPPSRGFRCEYVARQIEVKAVYGLWVTAAERDAMRRVLDACHEPAP